MRRGAAGDEPIRVKEGTTASSKTAPLSGVASLETIGRWLARRHVLANLLVMLQAIVVRINMWGQWGSRSIC